MTKRKKDTPEKAAMREMMKTYLKENNVDIKSGEDVNSIMRNMMSVLLEGALDEELNEELGYSSKTMHTSYWDMELEIPRDRKGKFEPQLIRKYQNTVTQDMEEKIISMYAKGMTTGDIESHMKELYDIDISDSTISRITDKILPIVKEWQQHPLEPVYAVVLGMYVGENESARFWFSIINGLRNRGVEDILIACVDGLNGFPQTIEAVYPQTENQQYIIHQMSSK